MLELFHNIREIINPTPLSKIVSLVIFMALGMGLEVAGISLLMPIIQTLLYSDEREYSQLLVLVADTFDADTPRELLYVLLIQFVIFYLVKTVFLTFLHYRINSFVFSIQALVSGKLFKKYLSQDLNFHYENNKSVLVRNTIGEVQHFTGIVNAFLIFVTEGLILLGLIIFLLFFEPIGLFSLGIFLGFFIYFIMRVSENPLTLQGDRRQIAEEARLRHLNQALKSVGEIKLRRKEQFFFDVYSSANESAANAGKILGFTQAMPRIWLEFGFAIAILIIFLVSFNLDKSNDTIFEILSVFAIVGLRLMPSFTRLVNSSQVFKYFRPVVREIRSELTRLDVESYKPSAPLVKLDTNVGPLISVDTLSFRYPSGSYDVLSNVNLSIHKGQKVGVVGSSGSGKSTLMNLLLGLLEPTRGKVLVYGRDLQDVSSSWGARIGYVPQDVFLLDASIAENVAFGFEDKLVDLEKVNTSLQRAGLRATISALPDGLQTRVGEDGNLLSGGQKQRLGIARALYLDPDILFLDEATSALDGETEKLILNELDNFRGDATVILITHRLEVAQSCDTVIKLEAGSLLIGDHQTIIED